MDKGTFTIKGPTDVTNHLMFADLDIGECFVFAQAKEETKSLFTKYTELECIPVLERWGLKHMPGGTKLVQRVKATLIWEYLA